MPSILVNGIVAARNMQPYVRLSIDDRAAQLTVAEARNIANNIIQMCARTEADAMIVKFFGEREFPQAACAALLDDFRDFRSGLDKELVETLEEKERPN